MKKVTAKQLEDAIHEYGYGPRPERMGQFLMNTLVPDEADSEIFYSTDNIAVVDMFVKRFVEEEG